MGLSGISLTQMLVILAIVLVVFGTKRVKSLGSDLGGAIKGFREAMDADDHRSVNRFEEGENQRRIGSHKDSKSDAESFEPTENVKHG